ncbi:MAG TPA: nuclear transport factor 2 family protein [Solirubrobacteraceae bacterium]|nr:nuclear transport factor 2 family protein [Solirubrobacteraceae bacterium]
MAAPAPDDVARRSPAELSDAFGRALARGDLDMAMEMWAKDASIIDPAGEVVSGRQAIGEVLRALIDNGAEVGIKISRVIEAGDVALGLGTLTLSGTGSDGERFRQQSSSAVIYSRAVDGQWQLAIDAPWGLPDA